MPNGFLDRINKSTVTIGGVGGLITALTALYAPIEKLPQPYASYLGYVFGAITAAFVVIVLRAGILAVPQRSVLRDLDAFVLRRELPEHLVGRTNDIDLLEEELNETLLLFVEGESGVGKSALLRAGLVPRLRAGHRYLPVYIESLSGLDWIEGPWRAVIPAFRATLDTKAPPPSRKPNAEVLEELLEAAHLAGRMPVLIIDQFDDYQLSHSALFLRTGTWLGPAELVAENPFWAALYAALDGHRLQLVIATRNDMALGLEAVRFIKPLPYHVDKVPPKYLRALIERLAGTASDAAGAIDAPLATWPDLRERLLDDLASGGEILPQQLKVALLGLQGLPRQQLTTAAYMAVGGVGGLEANWIGTQINRAARKSKLSSSVILRLLVALCEPDAVAKTWNLSLSALSEMAGLEDHVVVETALMALEEGEVVCRLASEDLNESLWRLDHDYIAGVVNVVNRGANRWELTLAEGRKALAGASGVAGKWEALLPLKTQMQFFLDRAKGRFRYESGCVYAFISLARFAPAMLTVLLITLGYQMVQTNTTNRELAARISAGFDTNSEISSTERKNIIDLSLSNISVARGVVGRMLDDTNLAKNFAEHMTPMMDALDLAVVGNWAALAESAEPFAQEARGSKGVSEIYVASMLLYKADRASEAVTLLVGEMKANKDDADALSRLADGLGAIADRVPQEAAGQAASLLVAALEANKRDAFAPFALVRGLRNVGNRLPHEAAGQLADRLVAVMEANKENAKVLSPLAESLDAIRDRVPQETAGQLASRLVAAMVANKDDIALSYLAIGLGAMGGQVPQETAGKLANRLVVAMEANKGAATALSQLTRGLSAIGTRVPLEKVRLAANLLVAAMEANKGDFEIMQLISGLRYVGNRLPHETAGQLANRLVAAMEGKKDDADGLIWLAGGLRAIAGRVPQETADKLVNRLVAAMAANKGNALALSGFAVGLGAIGDRVPQETAGLAATRLVVAMEARGSANALSRLAEGLNAIGDRVPQETAGRLADRLVAEMEAQKGNAYALFGLGSGLGSIGDRVPKIKAQLLSSRLDTLLPQCSVVIGCHVARITLHSVLSKERAIHLVFLAGRDPLIGREASIVQRLGRLTESEFNNWEGWDAAEAWLRKHRTTAGVDDADVRKELRDLMRKREALSGGQSAG